MNELNHTNGKGDKERSPGWRANYDDIDFQRGISDGFARRGNRLVKTYTPGRKAVFTVDLPKAVLVCGGRCHTPGETCRCLTTVALHGNKDSGWICTLPEGHAGDHIACGGGPQHDMFRWPRTLKEEAAFLSSELLARGVKL